MNSIATSPFLLNETGNAEERATVSKAENRAQPATSSCPECGKKLVFHHFRDLPHFPFCCERCKTLDLGRWLRGEYSLERSLDPFSEDDGELLRGES